MLCVSEASRITDKVVREIEGKSVAKIAEVVTETHAAVLESSLAEQQRFKDIRLSTDHEAILTDQSYVTALNEQRLTGKRKANSARRSRKAKENPV